MKTLKPIGQVLAAFVYTCLYTGLLYLILVQQLKNLAVMAGIKGALSSHWARHTGATLLLNSGAPMEVVSRVLGHSSTKITREVYAKMLDETIADAMSKIDYSRK